MTTRLDGCVISWLSAEVTTRVAGWVITGDVTMPGSSEFLAVLGGSSAANILPVSEDGELSLFASTSRAANCGRVTPAKAMLGSG